MRLYEVDFYEAENGECQIEDFLAQIDIKMLAKIRRIIDMLEKNGPEVRMPYSRPLGDGIFEIRAKQGSNITRVLYFFYIDKKIILTNGFTKKTQKTPKREIEIAKRCKEDYERRYRYE